MISEPHLIANPPIILDISNEPDRRSDIGMIRCVLKISINDYILYSKLHLKDKSVPDKNQYRNHYSI